MKSLLKSLSLFLCVNFCAGTAFAQSGIVDIPVNGEKTVTTVRGLAGLPPSLGSAEDYVVVLRLASLMPGKKYEATLTYDAGTEIGYGHAWVDGNPFEKDWASFVGIGTGTGSRELHDKQEKFLFTIDLKSTSSTLYVAMRTNKPFTFRFSVSDRLSGVTPNSQDSWGYYYVTDFDADHHSPFLLVRGQTAVALPSQPSVQGPWVDIPVNGEKTATTVQGLAGLPPSLGSAEDYVVVLRLAQLMPGKRYEATLTYDAGTETSYGHAWVDGNPFEKDWTSFVGIGTGTGSREMQGKQEKFLFTIDPKSSSSALYVALRTNKPFTFRFSLSDRLSGVTRDSQDNWGYYYVTDFDANRNSPFLLVRGQAETPALSQPEVQGPWVNIPVNGEKTVATAQGLAGLPPSLGSAEDYVVVLRLAQLMPGKKYEATLTYDAGTDIGYGHAWVDGNPFEKDWTSFVGIGTGTGSREMQGKQEKFLFTIDPQSSSSALYVALRTNKPFSFRFSLSDRLSGVTRDSQDSWGYYYVTDFDANRNSPFLLKR